LGHPARSNRLSSENRFQMT